MKEYIKGFLVALIAWASYVVGRNVGERIGAGR